MSLCSHLAAGAWRSAWRIWTRSSCPYTWSRPRAPWRGHLVTSGTDYCPCSHLEQVEAVSADVGEAGEGCGVVKASAEIIIYIPIQTCNCSYLQERSMDCNCASASISVELPSRETIWLSAGTFIDSYSSLLLKLLVTTRHTIILLASPLVLLRGRQLTLGRLRRALVRAAVARAVTQPRHALVPGHRYRAPRSRNLDIRSELCMKTNLTWHWD